MDTIERAVEKLQEITGEAKVSMAAREPAGVPSEQHRTPEASEFEAQSLAEESAECDVILDFERLAELGMVTPETARSGIASEFRAIKRPLLKSAFGQGETPLSDGNMIMVTSAQPGEGKTFVSINLALSIAMEMDTTVLLIDADVVRPSVSRTLGLPPMAGLVDYLLDGDRDISDLLLKTNIPKLTILPAGRQHHHSTELLHSEAMRQLTREMARRYPDRIVLFDSPPLLATTEAAVLAGMMGQVLVVVEAEKTSQDAVNSALELLDPSLHVSFILNKMVRSKSAGSYYGYYGYYGQGQSD